jgi:glycosyltransferase involved in cell wall biosynthesis
VTTLVSEPDAGIYAAMNKGWQRATGEYCLFLNAGDDLHNPEVLGSLVSWLAQTDADYLYGNLRTVDADGSSGIQEFNEPVSLNYLFRWFVPHPASCIRRSLLLQLKGYSEEYRIISDWVFSIQAFCQGARFEHVPLCIANFYLDGISSTQQALAAREKQRVFEAELAWLKHDWEWYHRVRPLELSRPVRWLHRLIAAFK